MPLDRTSRAETSILTAASQKLGVPSVTLHRYIAGRQRPMLPMLRRIEEAFGWPLDAQMRLIPDRGSDDQGWSIVLTEVLKEHYADTIDDPDFPPAVAPSTIDRVRKKPRASPGWSHYYVADQLNTKVGNVTRWLNGDRYPDVRAIVRIEEIWGWPATEQIVLIPARGYDPRYGTAFRAWLDAKYPNRNQARVNSAPPQQLGVV